MITISQGALRVRSSTVLNVNVWLCWISHAACRCEGSFPQEPLCSLLHCYATLYSINVVPPVSYKHRDKKNKTPPKKKKTKAPCPAGKLNMLKWKNNHNREEIISNCYCRSFRWCSFLLMMAGCGSSNTWFCLQIQLENLGSLVLVRLFIDACMHRYIDRGTDRRTKIWTEGGRNEHVNGQKAGETNIWMGGWINVDGQVAVNMWRDILTEENEQTGRQMLWTCSQMGGQTKRVWMTRQVNMSLYEQMCGWRSGKTNILVDGLLDKQADKLMD